MAFTFGFYNANLGSDGLPDRSYDATDFGKYLDGIISDGVVKPYGDAFKVSIVDATARKISIGTGKGWFNGTWNILDEPMEFILLDSPSDNYLSAVILAIDKKSRINRIYTAAYGNKITLNNRPNEGYFEYCLAGVRITNHAILRANNHIGEGSPLTPWSTCLLTGEISSGGGSGAYTTGIQFVTNGFNLTFSDATGLQYVNEFAYVEADGKLVEIRNKTLGRGITVSYSE